MVTTVQVFDALGGMSLLVAVGTLEKMYLLAAAWRSRSLGSYTNRRGLL